MTLFIDCDDTLVLWDDVKGVNTSWKPNFPLIRAVLLWREKQPGEEVVVWSGGGADYALGWAKKLLGTFMFDTVTDKYLNSIKSGDIWVDDQKLNAEGIGYLPDTFVRVMER